MFGIADLRCLDGTRNGRVDQSRLGLARLFGSFVASLLQYVVVFLVPPLEKVKVENIIV